MLLLQSGALLSPHRIHALHASDAWADLSDSTLLSIYDVFVCYHHFRFYKAYWMATPPFDSCGFTLRIFHSWEWSRIDRGLSSKIEKDMNKKSVRWRFKMNPLKAHRTGLHPLLRHCQNKPLCPTGLCKLTSKACPILYPFAISKPALKSSNSQLCCMWDFHKYIEKFNPLFLLY
jgi:hypothetical protein